MKGTREPIERQELEDAIAELGDLTDASLLKYQQEFYEDDSRLVGWVKGRQIGGTRGASYKVTQDAAKADFPAPTYWISKDEDLAREFILYCLVWISCWNSISNLLASVDVIQVDKDVTTLQIRLPNGARIIGLSSNASAAVGRAGNIWIDEFALHDDQEGLYRFAKPCINWGYRFYIISTCRGEDTLFEKLRNDPKFGFSWHVTTIEDAVADGIVEKMNIKNRRNGLPELTGEEFLKQCRDECVTEADYLQEYMCVPQGSRDSWLQWNWIMRAQADDSELSINHGGTFFLGMDVGKVKDASYIVVLEKFAGIYFVRYIWRGKCEDYDEINAHFDQAYNMFPISHACVDGRGVGERVSAVQIQKYGDHMITGIEPGNAINAHLSALMYENFGKFRVRIPRDDALARDLFAVKEVIAPSGVKRYIAPHSWKLGHSDGYAAISFALLAAEEDTGPEGMVGIPKAQEETEDDLDRVLEELEKGGNLDMLDLI